MARKPYSLPREILFTTLTALVGILLTLLCVLLDDYPAHLWLSTGSGVIGVLVLAYAAMRAVYPEWLVPNFPAEGDGTLTHLQLVERLCSDDDKEAGQ